MSPKPHEKADTTLRLKWSSPFVFIRTSVSHSFKRKVSRERNSQPFSVQWGTNPTNLANLESEVPSSFQKIRCATTENMSYFCGKFPIEQSFPL